MLSAFQHFYPERVSGYSEPFVGSGALFFDLLRRGALGEAPVTLGDSNPDLIGTYTAVRDAPDEVIDTLARLDQRHAREGADVLLRRARPVQRRAAWAQRDRRREIFARARGHADLL